jgi:hypothetical protein
MWSRWFAAKLGILLVVASLPGCGSAPVNAPSAVVATVNYEGLATVRSSAFKRAEVRPDTDFRAYSRLRLGAPGLAYRTPDRAERQFLLTEEQKLGFRDALAAAFDREFAGFTALELVNDPGPATLTLDIRVEDIVAAVARDPVAHAGRAAAFLEASGDAVIILELRDSQSNEILARGVDPGTATGSALRVSKDELRSSFESAEKLVAKWAAKARVGLENLLSDRR